MTPGIFKGLDTNYKLLFLSGMKLEHEFVPKHEVMAPEDAENVLRTYKVGRDELPKIKIDDPAIKDFEANVGDIIKITRNSPTAGKAVYYRVVI